MQAAASQGLTYTVFRTLDATTKSEITCTWRELCAKLREPKVHPSKVAMPLMKGATFGDVRDPESGSLRTDGNMLLVSFIEADIDNKVAAALGALVTVDDVETRLRDAGIEALLFTTGSHAPDRHRIRVLAPLSTPCPPADRAGYVATLNGALGGILETESFTASQSFYFGRVAGVPFEARHVAGGFINEDLFIVPVDARPTPRPARQQQADDDLADLSPPIDDETMAEIAAAAKALSPHRFGEESHDDYMRVFWALRHAAACGRSTEARDLMQALTEAHGTDAKKREFARKWEREKPTRASHFKVLFDLATDDGWVNPRKAPTPESVVERLRKMSRDEVLHEWAPLAAAMPKDCAADVLAAVHQLTAIGKRDLANRLKDARRDVNRTRRVQAVGSRKLLVYQPENSVAQATEVGALILESAPPGALVNHAGRPARIVEAYQPNAHQIDDADAPPPMTMVVEGHTQASMRAEVESVAVFHVVREADMIPVAVPVLTLEALLELDAAQAPPISGVLSHPIVRIDGSILAANGIDSRTGLFAHGITGGDTLRPYSQQEAESARLWLETEALVGFEFASKLNAHIALAGLLTAVQRRLMDTAPGLAILAPAQASGKTTLARRFHLFLTGRDMPVVTLPVGNDPEIGKLLLSLLQSSPPMICFDNISDGLVVHGGPLNAAMTSPTFEGRILGSTKTLTVPTNTFFVVTGNNLRLGSDEVTRLLTTTLAPAHARPEERRFRQPDVVAHALSIRDRVLRDVVGIVAGYLTSGDRVPLATGSRFNRWDRMVRQPLVWAGADDVAKSFEINGSEAEHVQALRSLLLVLHEEFADERFSARQVCDLVAHFDQTRAHLVHDALEALAVRDVRSPRGVGKALQGCLNRAVEVDGATLSLRASIDRNGTSAYGITKCGVCGV